MAPLYFYLDGYDHSLWRQAFASCCPGLDFVSYPDWDPDTPAYAFVWNPPAGLLADYPNLKAVFSLGAGMDHLIRDPQLPNLPLIRMSDDGLRRDMAHYILMSTLMLSRQMPTFIRQQKEKEFSRAFYRSPQDINVGLLGYGNLGQAAAELLHTLGFQLSSWSKRAKDTPLTRHYVGEEQFSAFARDLDIAICLLPSTPDTKGFLNKNRLLDFKKGAAVINAGRGNLIVEQDLHDLLEVGHLSAAMLDVFEIEPLPADHPFWTNEKIIITPHVAAITQPLSAARYVIKGIKALEAGQQPEGLFDRARGY